jgi:hypothetical protein
LERGKRVFFEIPQILCQCGVDIFCECCKNYVFKNFDFFDFFNVFKSIKYADIKNNFKKIKKYHFNFNIFLNKKTL